MMLEMQLSSTSLCPWPRPCWVGVIEYSAKYEAAGKLNHVKKIIKRGTNYFFINDEIQRMQLAEYC